MFFRAVKYKLIRNVTEKENFFWTLCFPLILATFFNMAFGNLAQLDTLEGVKVAVVDEDKTGTQLIQTLEEVNVFSTEVTTQDNAEKLMKDGKITAIVNIKNSKVQMTVRESNMSETIVKSVLDKISQTTSTVTNIYKINPAGDKTSLNNLLENQQTFTQQSSDTSKNNDPYSIFFFALIAMTCLFAAQTSLYSVVDVQGNQSIVGARQNIAPTSKMVLFGGSITADLISQCIGTTILLAYIKYILKYNIGDFSIWLLLICYVSIFASICLGAFVGAAIKAKITAKNAFLTAISLASCGVAGLFAAQVKIALERKLPIIAYINPATLISDGMISLYYFDSMQMYFTRLAILLSAGIVLFAATCLILRRQRYASI